MITETINKQRYKATKGLLKQVLQAGSELTIFTKKPSGALFNLFSSPASSGFDNRRFRETIRHLKDYNYVSVKEKSDEIIITLLEAGHERALKYSIDDILIPEPAVWDKKWRLVMFDIPEENRLARTVFKEKLDELGFALLQKSVYIYPYPCHNELEFIRNLYNISQHVKLLVVEKVEEEEQLRKRFSL